jgi:uncharacterized repeat protein (TIGR01451 family)
MKKLMVILLTLAIVTVFAAAVHAQNTANGTTIDNWAKVDAANIASPISNNVTTNVQRIVGAMYVTGTGIPLDTTGAAGSTVNLVFTVNNQGNANDTFTGSIVGIQAQTNDLWSWSVEDSLISGTAFAYNSTTTYTLQVVIPGTATNNSFMEFQVDLVSDSSGSAIKSGAYTNDNPGDSTAYCGDMGISMDGTGTNDDATLRHGYVSEGTALANTWIRVTVTGPVLRISKSITGVTLGGVASTLVPGATIGYSIVVSNIGVGTANDVVISDQIPNNTKYVAGSATIANALNAGDWAISVNGGLTGSLDVTNDVSGLETTNGGGANGWVELTFDVTVD